MELLVVIVVVIGLWAALLLPSFLDSRHDAPLTSTRSFDRRIARLAAIRAEPMNDLQLARRRVLARRRRAMIALLSSAVVTLLAAILTGSIPLLLLSLALDGIFVAYLVALNQVQDRQPVQEPVIQEQLRYGELRLVTDDDYPQAANR